MERRNETTMRKSKCQYSPAPRILQLPTRRQSVRRNASKGKTPPSLLSSSSPSSQRVKLEVLFREERSFDRGVNEEEEGRRRGKVVGLREIVGPSSSSAVDEVEEAKWRFQAEMLRSECNLLRIEKEIATKKMERRKKRMERTLRSAVLTLLSAKQRISEGNKESKALEDEISYMVEKLNELKSPKVKDMEARNRRHNFDRQASVLRRELEKFDEGGVSEEVCVKGIQKMAEASFFVHSDHSGNIDTLSSKMEALSKGVLLERMEKEYGSSLFAPPSSSVSKGVDLTDASVQEMYSKAIQAHEEKKECSRHCKAVMRKIADEVRAEAEQWSQMQEMLGQVRKEMEELQSCRDFWQNRALESDSQLENLHSSVEGWRRKALSSEAKLKNLQAEVCRLQEEMNRMRKEHKIEQEKNKLPSETEKRVLICRLKENRESKNGDCSNNNEGRRTKASHSRLPLREIKNSSTVAARHRNSSVVKM